MQENFLKKTFRSWKRSENTRNTYGNIFKCHLKTCIEFCTHSVPFEMFRLILFAFTTHIRVNSLHKRENIQEKQPVHLLFLNFFFTVVRSMNTRRPLPALDKRKSSQHKLEISQPSSPGHLVVETTLVQNSQSPTSRKLINRTQEILKILRPLSNNR